LNHVFRSPLSGQQYNIYPISPVLVRLITSESVKTEESTKIELELLGLAEQAKADHEALMRTGIDDDSKKEITERLAKSQVEQTELSAKLISIARIKPATIVELAKMFVQELQDISDRDVLHLGPDLDLLYMQIQILANKNAGKYANAIDTLTSPLNSAGNQNVTAAD
jgi:hypothetical protein